MKTFLHRFSNLEIDDQPSNGMISTPTVIWKGQPRKKHMRLYILWMHSINEQCSSDWNVELVRCYRTPKKTWEHYAYTPGQPARLDYVSESGPAEPYGETNHMGVFHAG